jgi:hypothetical protein
MSISTVYQGAMIPSQADLQPSSQSPETPPAFLGRSQLIPARPTVAARPADPLTEADYLALRQCAAARGPLRRAARTARGSAVTTLMIAAAGAAVMVFSPTFVNVLMVLVVGSVGVIEYIGARQLQRGDVSAPGLLGRNQLVFLGFIVAYCLYQMACYHRGGLHEMAPDLESQLGQVQGAAPEVVGMMNAWAPLVAYGFYSLVIVVSAAVQGGMAIYYFTRRKHVAVVQAGTPEWIQRVFHEIGV